MTAGFLNWLHLPKITPWLFVFLALLLLLCSREGHTQQSAPDRESYYRAVEYCRGDVSRPMALSPDGQVLCFDGDVAPDLDLSLARDLKEDGLFIVRSFSGQIAPAIALSDLIRGRHVTVVVYDYCFSVCANYFLIASYQTYVLKGAFVAWDYGESSDPASPFCTASVWEWKRARDGGSKLQHRSCRPAFGDQVAYRAVLSAQVRFYRERAVDPSFEPPPDSLHVRQIVRNLWNVYAETGVHHDIEWTINPRYYPRLFKTKIFYEAYPESQEEVDSIAARLHLGKVIYDP